ncbi:hypothetical protein BG011_001698 [Mortierella polycephala]|uniref:Adhesin domain-containing protein n=1 Tax=Mortierella polycephala TaxID=41804 RepID=A0A9P6Q4Y0_9FUNG|nr:hypothetical protein BG011_001698 [Mortierella polycephala]
MGLFNKPLLPAHCENEDVQISADFCPNIAIHVIGLARGEITILSGNEDMIQIKTSVQAKESILRNAVALEPFQDGDRYTYTIHTPLEDKLEKSVTFQVFVTLPRTLDCLESFTINGTNLGLAIGNITHTFIRNLQITTGRGDVSIDGFYGESATIVNTITGGIHGKYSVARLMANAKSGKISSHVHLLNTDDLLPSPKIICSTANFRVDMTVDGTDLFGPFTVEAKTQCAPMEVKVLLAKADQRLLGNFINFGGPTRIRLSGNYQGRIETRTHYGKIFLNEPEFVRLEDAVLTIPSPSDRNAPALKCLMGNGDGATTTSLSNGSNKSKLISSRASSQGTSMSWEDDHHPHPHPHHDTHPSHNHTHSRRQQQQQQHANHNHCYNHHPPSSAGSSNGSDSHSKAESTTGSLNDTQSVHSVPLSPNTTRTEKQKDPLITRELIGTIGQGPGLIMIKNSSGDITFELI